MALTADQITVKNFKSFYDRIKPFLNGEAHAGFTPVGTVISYFGETAPQNYLICDGTQYNKADYPELWTHLSSLTDTTPYIVDGDNTKFKVPDLRGEFLRGTGTNGHTNNGDGANVGVHQDATTFIDHGSRGDGKSALFRANSRLGQSYSTPYNVDLQFKSGTGTLTNAAISATASTTSANTDVFTSRPTNTSVLYCIAYKNIFYDISEGQANAMPIPSVTYKDRIIQYVGDTDSNFTNGYFYKCIEDTSTSPYTYLWTNVNVGASNNNNSSNIWGYLYNNAFYEDSAHTTLIPSDTDALYIDKSSKNLYEFDGTDYIELSEKDKSIVYQPGGSYVFANLPSNIADNLGKVYNITDDFTTTTDFIEGAGIEYQANTDVSVINAGTTQNPIYKYNIFLGSLAGYQKKFRYTTMPTASIDYLNVIIQYIGATDTNYISGRFYKCIADNDNYSWTESQLKDNETETISFNDFNALSQAEKDNGKTYFVPDASPVANFTVMGNRFDKANIYTETERMIGSWLGKPLYQRTFEVTSFNNGDWTNLAVVNGENARIVDGYLVVNNAANHPINFYYSSSIYSFLDIKDDASVFWLKYAGVTILKVVLTIQYTKTTDGQIAIGTETDYSTDEVIVGTWIDGKPLYQKTLTGIFSGLTDKTEKVLYSLNDLPAGIDIGSSRIIGDASYVLVDNPISGVRNIPFVYGAATQVISAWLTVIDGLKIYTAGIYHALNGCRYYVTIQYTKTTD